VVISARIGDQALHERMTIAPYGETHFARIVALAADAIICIDRSQRITLFNQGAEKAFGYAPEEVLGKPLDILIPKRFRRGHDAHVAGFSAGPATARHMGDRRAIFALRKSGEEFPAEATISKTGGGGGEVMTVILRDITQQSNARGELERMVAERTQALEAEIVRRENAQDQLVKVQRLEAFGQLTGGVAHDFNNLLTVIGGNLELLRDRLPGSVHAKPLNRAVDAVAMGARLTQRLLSFARRSRLEPEVLDLNGEVLALIDLLRRTLGESITISSVLAPDLWRVKADASQIENAILNLAINARDAMPDGGRLIIETANAAVSDGFPKSSQGEAVAPGDYVRITISDTGTGMAPDVLARAFEPFFTTKEPGRGTGLGLASIYGFVRQSGGHAAIYSEPGRGTTVSVYLPRSAAEHGEPSAASDLSGLPAAPGGRILVAEDNPEVRETTIDRLESLGFEVTACGSAAAAMDLISGGGDFDLVFSDVVMPGGKSGLDLAAWIRERKPELPVLLTSGFTEELIRAEAGADPPPVLRKPYGSAELAAAVLKLLKRP
jgi:PAS domain S-box-containing protein